MKSISVCLSPDLLHLEEVEGKIVVVIDIFRATTCMVTGLASGIVEIVPVAEVDKCLEYKDKGYVLAGERNADKVEGFELDNSPFSYQQDFLKGKKVALTTTNGTNAINKVKEKAHQVLIGSFLNIGSLAQYLKEKDKDLLFLCSGWKGRVNLEDTLFAGAMCNRLKDDFTIKEDAALISLALFYQSNGDYNDFLKNSSHYNRLLNKGLNKDMVFALTENVYENIPVLQGEKLVNFA